MKYWYLNKGCGNRIISWDNCSAVTEMINHQYAVIQHDLTITFSWRLDPPSLPDAFSFALQGFLRWGRVSGVWMVEQNLVWRVSYSGWSSWIVHILWTKVKQLDLWEYTHSTCQLTLKKLATVGGPLTPLSQSHCGLLPSFWTTVAKHVKGWDMYARECEAKCTNWKILIL